MHQARALLGQGDGAGALAACCRILERDLGRARAYHAAGLALELLGNESAALASYGHASQLAPDDAAPLGALALLAQLGGDKAAARTWAFQALALDPTESAARLALARLALEDGQATETAAWLSAPVQPLLAATHQALAERTLGDALDELGRPAEAFACYAASAAIFRRQFAGRCAGPQPLAGLELCRRLQAAYRAAKARLWTPAPEASGSRDEATGHVFVIGFPRSGTTLLEQVLASHPQVTTLEEQLTLTPAIDAYLDPPTGVEALADMDEATADHWRRDYWARVRGFGVEPAGKVFVDKQPFYTLWLPLIGKLFPRARILVVRRDPRDVVLSCFRKPFRMTPVTYELMDLERSARLYAGAMDILDLFLDRASNPRMIYRHEDLVDDFDGVSRGICAFLGLEWTERLRDFAATARGRRILTPSASQVVRGLNRDGIGAWRPYAPMLEPAAAILDPLAEAYGYGT